MEQEVVTVGLDLAKNVFQVHAIAADGAVLIRRKLRRSEVIRFFGELSPCLVGMEACASAHHWARELIAIGHEVRLMPPAYVKPYVKRGKTDAADAEAICEAVTRPTMRFVAVKSVEQQAVLMLHKSRDLMVRQRTMLINALRGHLAEYGIVTGLGAGGANRVMSILNSMLNKAEAWGYRLENTNPCRVVRLNRKRKCERFLSHAELGRLGKVLTEARGGEHAVRASAATAVTMLLLTGCRVGEITSLQWRDVRGNRLKLRDSSIHPVRTA